MKLTEKEFQLHQETLGRVTKEQVKALKKVRLRFNGDGTLTLQPGNESVDARGRGVTEIADDLRWLFPSGIPTLDIRVIEALVRTALGRRGQWTYLKDAI